MSILLGRNSIRIKPCDCADAKVYPGRIDCIFKSQRAVQPRAAPTPLPQGAG